MTTTSDNEDDDEEDHDEDAPALWRLASGRSRSGARWRSRPSRVESRAARWRTSSARPPVDTPRPTHQSHTSSYQCATRRICRTILCSFQYLDAAAVAARHRQTVRKVVDDVGQQIEPTTCLKTKHVQNQQRVVHTALVLNARKMNSELVTEILWCTGPNGVSFSGVNNACKPHQLLISLR